MPAVPARRRDLIISFAATTPFTAVVAPLGRFGRDCTLIDWREKSREVGAQCERESVEDIHRRIEILALDAANISPVHRGIDGEVLLGDASFDRSIRSRRRLLATRARHRFYGAHRPSKSSQ